MENNYGAYSSSQQTNGTGRASPKDFKQIAQKMGTDIQKISQNVSSMKKMVTLIGTSQDSHNLKQELHQLHHYTQNMVKDTCIDLKALGNLPPAFNPSEQRENRLQKDRLTEEFTAAVNAFQSIQRFELQKEQEEVKRTRANSNIQLPPAKDVFGENRFSDQLIELQDSNLSRKQIQDQLQDEVNLQMLREQEESIHTLEKNISEVNDIFKELATMVHDQGEIVDSIEANVENTEVRVHQGVSELRQASNYSTKLRKKRCILFSCVVIILAILLMVIFWGN